VRPKHTACVDGTNRKNVLWWRAKCILTFMWYTTLGWILQKLKLYQLGKITIKIEKKVSVKSTQLQC
jgi:hypothetical protein